jgi:hypothetical protein
MRHRHCDQVTSAPIDNSLFDAFFDKVHSWYPFLDRVYWNQHYVNAFEFSKHPTSDSVHCMILMVLALGYLAQDDRLDSDIEAHEFTEPAFAMLPAVILGNDVTSAQCLILFWYHLRICTDD